MLQVADHEEALQAIALIASGTDICNVQYQQEFKCNTSLAYFTLKASFWSRNSGRRMFPLSQLRDLVINPFDQTTSTSHLPSPLDSKLSFFPNLPMVRRSPPYIDFVSRKGVEQHATCSCKYPSSHPTLTPGILQCPHGIC